MMEFSPRTKLETRFYRAAIEGIDHFVKINTKLLSNIQVLCFTYQNLGKVLTYSPILLLVRFCEYGLGHSLESGPVQIPSAEVKCSLNVSQTGRVSELGKTHYHELVTTGELYGVPVAIVSVDALLELIFIDDGHNLCENCFPFVHGLRGTA